MTDPTPPASEWLTREQVSSKLAYLSGTGLPTQVKCVGELRAHDAAQRAKLEQVTAERKLLDSYHKYLLTILGYDLENSVPTDPTVADKIIALQQQLATVTAERDKWKAHHDSVVQSKREGAEKMESHYTAQLDLRDEALDAIQQQLADMTAERDNYIKRIQEEEPIFKSMMQQLAERDAEIAGIRKKYQVLVAWFDQQHGTPCEQIRHKQEVDTLQARVTELEAAAKGKP